jgi:hypothetical protein
MIDLEMFDYQAQSDLTNELTSCLNWYEAMRGCIVLSLMIYVRNGSAYATDCFEG